MKKQNCFAIGFYICDGHPLPVRTGRCFDESLLTIAIRVEDALTCFSMPSSVLSGFQSVRTGLVSEAFRRQISPKAGNYTIVIKPWSHRYSQSLFDRQVPIEPGDRKAYWPRPSHPVSVHLASRFSLSFVTVFFGIGHSPHIECTSASSKPSDSQV